MERFSTLMGSVTRRGMLVGAAGIGTALAIRSRPSDVGPRAVPPGRDFPVPDLLLSPAEIPSRLAQILDASELADYRGDHIPGARHVWWQDTMELNSLWYGTVLKPDDGQSDQTRRQRLLERWQVQSDLPVVVYDRGDGSHASRVAWFLRFLGVPAQVLDGGYAGWLALEESLRVPMQPGATGMIATAAPRQGFYLSVSQVVDVLNQPDVMIVDVRTNRERVDGAMPGRSAPGAQWLSRDELSDDEGLIKPPAELATVLAHAGIDLSRLLVAIGDTGLDSAKPWLALSLMGANVAICDGGWQQWADLPELPAVPL